MLSFEILLTAATTYQTKLALLQSIKKFPLFCSMSFVSSVFLSNVPSGEDGQEHQIEYTCSLYALCKPTFLIASLLVVVLQ